MEERIYTLYLKKLKVGMICQKHIHIHYLIIIN